VPNQRQQYGKQGEQAAERFLKKQGYTIVCRNFRTPVGEIDLVAKEKAVIAFVEVKARQTESFGSPRLSITPEKQRKITQAALWYLKETGQSTAKARFDVVIVRGPDNAVELIKNAFEARLG
jgi:putative endonuclease